MPRKPRHRFLFSCVALLACLALEACGNRKGHSPISPDLLVLKRADVPHDFIPLRSNTHFVSTVEEAKTAHLKASDLKTRGRINGYEAQYERSGLAGITRLPPGVLIIDSNVSLWKDSAGAQWGFSRASRTIRRGKAFRITPLRTKRIGNETLAFSTNLTFSGFSFTGYTLAFRRGQYTATVTVVGAKGKVDLPQALHYAKLLDSRIKKSG